MIVIISIHINIRVSLFDSWCINNIMADAMIHDIPSDDDSDKSSLPPKKIVYVGAGFHLEPLKHFRDTSEFVFVEILPLYTPIAETRTVKTPLYSKTFYLKLLDTFRRFGFYLESQYVMETIDEHENRVWYNPVINYVDVCGNTLSTNRQNEQSTHTEPECLIFVNPRHRQTVHYYISTDIKTNRHPAFIENIRTADALMVSGFMPNKCIIEMIQKPVVLICYTRTYFRLSSYADKSDLLYYLHQHTARELKSVITDIYLLDYKKGAIIGRYNHIKQLCNELYDD